MVEFRDLPPPTDVIKPGVKFRPFDPVFTFVVNHRDFERQDGPAFSTKRTLVIPVQGSEDLVLPLQFEAMNEPYTLYDEPPAIAPFSFNLGYQITEDDQDPKKREKKMKKFNKTQGDELYENAPLVLSSTIEKDNDEAYLSMLADLCRLDPLAFSTLKSLRLQLFFPDESDPYPIY